MLSFLLKKLKSFFLSKVQIIISSFSIENSIVEALPSLTLNETPTELEPVIVEEVISVLKSNKKTNCRPDSFNTKLLND